MLYCHKLRYLGIVSLILGISLVCHATETETEAEKVRLIGDVSSGSGATAVHNISLYDEKGFVILPEVNFNQPFSIRQSCGRCHDYETISAGWHFNAADEKVQGGRCGQPWIYWDCSTATQIPLSYRAWPGTFKPGQLGLTRWWFTRIFGRHFPGGGAGIEDTSSQPAPKDRWPVSGELEINCMACHDGEASHDQAEYARQISQDNFRWAAAGSCGFASVTGSAKELPDFQEPSDQSEDAPTVFYDAGRFLPDRKVFLDIVGKVPNERCYFCHSSKVIGQERNEDVHLSAGLSCVDCHRNGLDHMIARGYEGEGPDSAKPFAASASCEGCHLGEEEASEPTEGRLGAPRPKHAGIPVVHFDKLSCTACHSGPRPRSTTFRIKTSRAHALGTHNANESDDTLPYIQSPVFARGPDGKIAPHNLLWPAYWAYLSGESVAPIAPEIVKSVAGKTLYLDVELASASWPELSEETIAVVLTALSSTGAEGEAVYICGGKLYRLVEGKIIAREHDAGRPYMWPIAHNVRPASQSLGAVACEDCHATDKAFIFGKVAIDSPLVCDKNCVRKMMEFQDGDAVYAHLFAMSFVFRPWLKVTALASCAVLAAVVILYAFKGLACILKVLAGENR